MPRSAAAKTRGPDVRFCTSIIVRHSRFVHSDMPNTAPQHLWKGLEQALGSRTVLIGGAAVLAMSDTPAAAQNAGPAIHVPKDPNCGCCTAWIDILERVASPFRPSAASGRC
jgi:hypothetical protein